MNEKPVSIILMEARKSIEDAINASHLDATIMLYILKDICRDVEQAANAKLMMDINKYNSEIQKENAEKENTENNAENVRKEG